MKELNKYLEAMIAGIKEHVGAREDASKAAAYAKDWLDRHYDGDKVAALVIDAALSQGKSKKKAA